MKKIIFLIISVLLVVPTMNAQNTSKALEKALKKEYKIKKKELKKGNWELFASSRTLDVALLSHYEKLNSLGENGYEVVGVASRFKSKNLGHQQAVNNACLTYAQQAGSHLKGRIVSDMSGNADDTAAEFDHFYAAYERLVEKEIKGEMVESFSIIRCLDKEKGEYEMQTYFIIDEAAATRARIRALENAAKESEVAQKYASKVSQFVREGFE
ncbi:MAG: hypothetical protein IKT82_07070 [Bacteroidaceae bacterium]|nr:hypothetical protein [Bacteroidaceae bacterium]